MKKNALASLALVFATAFVLAEGNLGSPTKVGSLSRSTDYVYTADQADAVVTNAINGVILRTGDDQSGDDENVVPSYGLVSAIIDGYDLNTVVKSVKISGNAAELRDENTATIPLASTSAAGAVQLSTSTNSNSTTLAATPSAVRDALAGAKAYADAKAASVAYTHPSYTARTGKPTANAAPSFGGTFTVSQVASDSSGHITGLTDRTITIPSTNATTTTAGLMSAADKSTLNALSSGAVVKSAIAAALQTQGLSAANDTAASLDDMDTIAAKLAAVIAVLDALD